MAETDSTEPTCSATLIVTGEDLEPELVTRLLAWTPDQAWRTGERKSFVRADGSVHPFDSVHQWGGWKRFIAAEFQNQHLDNQLAFWAGALSERSAAIKNLAQQGFDVELNCCVITQTTTVVRIPAELAGGFARLGINVSFTFYAHRPSAEAA